MKTVKLKPVFADLNNANTLKKGVKSIVKKKTTTPHSEILGKLKKEFEPLDFQLLAYPMVAKLRKQLEKVGSESEEGKEIQKQIDKFKLNTKHYLVLSIENVLKVANKHRWGICKNHDFIYLYNGAYWANIDKEAFQKFLGEAAEKMGVAKFSAKHYQFREHLYKQFLATAYLPTPENDKETVLINLENGTFQIGAKGTKLRAFNRADFLTYQLPFKYNPKAKASQFKKYLDKVLPDQQKQNILSEYLGFLFIKHGSKQLKEEKALILYGTGANGKSVFFEIINALLGSESVSHYSLQTLTDDKGYHRAKLANKLVNYASEINGKLQSDVFKQLVSGEPVEARLPYGEPFTLKNYAKLIFNCNELPKDVEHTNAYFRRFLIVPFDVTIPEAEQDKTLHIKIIDSELSGVFNWVLEGLNRLLNQKRFTDCEAVKEALKQYQIQSDSVQMYLQERGYKSSPDKYKTIKELYNDYRVFCVEDGFKPLNKTNFRKRLEHAKIITARITCGNVAYLSV
jgi:putative DNA primase/helicase